MMLADLTSHRIEGIAHMGNTPFSVPLFSQIDGNLWSGGCPRGQTPKELDFIICLYPWEPYQIHEHQVYTQARLFDSGEMPSTQLLIALARHVNECRAIGPTLVHCQAGLNRSGLVTALALMESGMTAAAAIALLREKRCAAVLCNRAFENWLLDYRKPALEWPAT